MHENGEYVQMAERAGAHGYNEGRRRRYDIPAYPGSDAHALANGLLYFSQ